MKIHLFTLLVLFLSTSSCNQIKEDKRSKEKTIDILFIGNSYLYYNSAPEMFNAMVKEAFPDIQVHTKLISGGGLTLEQHYQNPKTLEILKSKQWDYVVLQEQSELGSGVFIDNTKYYGSMEPFFQSARKFHDEIKKNGAKTVFLMTWSGKAHPEKQNYLSYAYSNIAKELDATLIPIGLVWNDARQKTQFDIYDNDGYHPSIYGSYLVASSIFSTLFKTNPSGISGNLSGHSVDNTGNKSSSESKLASLSTKEAQTIHIAAWNVVNSLNSTNGIPKIITKPVKEYSLPTLPLGAPTNKNYLYGTWLGSSRFDFVSDGLQLKVSTSIDEINIEIDIIRDGRNIKTEIVSKSIQDNKILLNFKDENERVRELSIVKTDNSLLGIIISTQGNYIKYDNIKFVKQ